MRCLSIVLFVYFSIAYLKHGSIAFFISIVLIRYSIFRNCPFFRLLIITRITVVVVFLSFIELSCYLFLISWQCASGLCYFLPLSLMNVSAKSDLYIQSFFKSWWQYVVSSFQCWRLRPSFIVSIFSKVFLLRNRKWLLLLFCSYLLSTSLVVKPLVKVLFFASKHFLIFCHHHFTLQS